MHRIVAVIVSMLLWQQTTMAAQLGEKSAPLTPEFAHVAVVHSVSASMAKQTKRLLDQGMQNYANQPKSFMQFLTQNSKSFDPQDAKFLQGLSQQFPAEVTLPKFVYHDGKYRTEALGVKISFSPADYWTNHITINDTSFNLDYQKGLADIYSQLQQQLTKKTSYNLGLIDDAQAFIPLIIWLAIFIVGALGISFWMKSKVEKQKIMAEALAQTAKDLNKQAAQCEQSRDNDAAYDETFGLLSGMMKGDGDGSNDVTKGIGVAMFRSIQEDSNVDCSESIKQIMKKAIGASPSVLSADFASARDELCGMQGMGDGSFDRLRGCMARFYSTHKELTKRRGSKMPWSVDDDTELIRDRRQYKSAVR